MRYFNFVLQASSEQIKENATINLREYSYQNPVAAMNSYMYQNMKNGICYFAYREEWEVTLAVFSYDDRRWLLLYVEISFPESKQIRKAYRIFCAKSRIRLSVNVQSVFFVRNKPVSGRLLRSEFENRLLILFLRADS